MNRNYFKEIIQGKSMPKIVKRFGFFDEQNRTCSISPFNFHHAFKRQHRCFRVS